MGKKILIDAGYDVLTVGNGLEALRKIAEAVPDIAILDIFMPGYTGLELCERLRASAATAALPVILTVGKLEPYRPEDGEHVHSNAIIVKPFAAAELISAVRSLIGSPSSKFDIAKTGHLDLSSDLLHEGAAGDTSVTFAPPQTTHGPTPEPFTELSQDEDSDEPLFSHVQAAASEDGGTFAPPQASVYGTEPSFSEIEVSGPESLVFNPDAKTTPFSASVLDLLPSISHRASDENASAFAEFDLEPAAYNSSRPEMETPALDAPAPSASADAGETARAASAQLSASEPLVVNHAIAQQSQQVVSDSATPLELESSPLEIPGLDPLLEIQEADDPVAVSNILYVGGEPEEIASEAAHASVTIAHGVATAPEPQLLEDETRRLAFEELFNSSESIPVENLSAISTETNFATVPNVADLPQGHPYEIAPEHEIEPLVDESLHDLIAPGADSYAMHEEEPAAPVSETLQPDPLLEDLLETNWAGSTQEPTEAIAAISSETYSSQPDEPIDIMHAALSEVASTETTDILSAEAIAPEALESTLSAELVQTPSEPAQPDPQLAVPEFVHLEAQPSQPEAVHSESKLDLSAPEAAPIEPTPEPIAPTSVKPELVHPELAPRQPETNVENISSSPELLQASETERIHQAVDRVFDRFKRLLVAAIVRELARHD
jgi:CheY-like chemotaxis protein